MCCSCVFWIDTAIVCLDFFFFKQKTAYEMRISDWSSDVCSSDLLDLTTPIGRGFLAFLSALAEDERERIHKRASEGRRAAVARGVHMGRKPKLTDRKSVV